VALGHGGYGRAIDIATQGGPMNQELPNLPSPPDWERQASPPSPAQGRLKALGSSSPIFDVFRLEQGRGLRLVGELDLSTVPDLLAVLDAFPAGADLLDLADLSFMDLSGLHALEDHARTLESRPLVLRNVSAQVRRLFELTGADLNPDIELRSDGRRG
jgi:anti-anti-sigma factor